MLGALYPFELRVTEFSRLLEYSARTAAAIIPDITSQPESTTARVQDRAPIAPKVVHVIAGALLIVAALLKTYQILVVPDVTSLSARLINFALIEFELALGGMLILKGWPNVAWWVALATFTIFAGASVKKAIAGASTCGCFGPATVNPSVTAAIDLLLILLLILVGARPPRLRRNDRLYRASAISIVVLMLVAGAAVAYAAMPKRGLEATENGIYDFGILSPEMAKRCEHTFRVRNTSDHALRITGFQSTCGCTVAELPALPIPPGESASVLVRADWSGVIGNAYARVTLETNNRWTPKVPLVINGEIRDAQRTSP